MLSFLPHSLKGVLAIVLYTTHTVILATVLIILALFKFIIPVKAVILKLDKILISISTLWIDINSMITRLFCKIEWDVRGLDQLEKDDWYLVLSNHQSWVDILALQTVSNRKIPMLKFFLKQELIWVPFLGLCWWALDFPFMKRYSKAQIQKNPQLKGADLASTRKACEKFKTIPVSVMNFVEGTRFTKEKHTRQESPFKNLLLPKAGGTAFVLQSMGEHLNRIIDITIVYPAAIPSFWDYLSGKVKKIIIEFNVMNISEQLSGDYFNDPVYKQFFFEWLNQLWEEKDKRIDELKHSDAMTC